MLMQGNAIYVPMCCKLGRNVTEICLLANFVSILRVSITHQQIRSIGIGYCPRKENGNVK